MATSRHVATPILGGRSASRRSGGKGVELYTLGGVRLLLSGDDITSKLGVKHLALLVYLFQEQRPMHPTEVFELFGRGQDEEKEMEGLRRVVTWLRENIGGVDIKLTAETIEAMGGVRLDTHDVDSAIDTNDAACVAELYVGEFLEGFRSGSASFDEWAQKERGRIKRAWSHAILSAARDAEGRGDWKTAAVWWQVLVDRAPIRPEAVAGHLNALASAGRQEDAARAYAAYVARLRENGAGQPADDVKKVLSQHPVLRQIAENQITPPTPSRPAASAPPPQPAPPPSPDAPTVSQAPSRGDAEPPEPPAAELIEGFESGAPPPIREDKSAVTPGPSRPQGPVPAKPKPPPAAKGHSPATPKSPPAPAPGKPASDSGLPDFLDDADEFDIPIEHPKKPSPPASGPREDRQPKRRSEEDEALSEAKKAAAAFVDTQYGRVRHEITSVRKPWAPVVQNWWKELGPVRDYLKEMVAEGIKLLARGLAALVPLLGRLFRATGEGAAGALSSARSRLNRDKKERGRPVKRDRGRGSVAVLEPPARKTKVARPKTKSPPTPTSPAKPKTPPPAKKPEPKVTDPASEGLFGYLGTEPSTERELSFDEAFPEEFGGPESAIQEPAARRQKAATTGAVPWEADIPAVKPRKPKKKLTLPKLPGIPVLPLLRLLRRFWYAPLLVAAVGAGVVFGPEIYRTVIGFTRDLPGRLPDVQAPSLPRVSIPRVTIRTPGFVETTVSRVGEMFSGPLLEEPGEWVLVADVEADGRGPYTSDVLTQALEFDLAQARFFSVVPRERAILARRRSTGNRSSDLPRDEALDLAASEGYALVLFGRVRHFEGNDSVAARDSVALRVFNPQGDTLYGVAAPVAPESNPMATLSELARAVGRRMGEPANDIEASKAPSQFLSESPDAIAAYYDARMQFLAGRYRDAATRARRATSIDPTFALAHHLTAWAEAMRGRRNSARTALETAWQLADGTTERERMRILGDWLAWEGRESDAAVTYDELFSIFRDDVGALKSQAILQRQIGVRGAGEGNLRVAYSIDPYDWPPLDRIARYLGYSGRLPDVDSLIAAAQSR